MDFIVKLPPSKEPLTEVSYDLILTIVDWLTKEVWFILYKEASNAEELAYIFLWNVTALQGLPDKIISDRDKLFTSNFWMTLMRQLRLLHKMSTVYHSQTDDQTEWMNQVIKQYLREYVDYHQTNWVALLSVVQIVYNTSVNQTTDITLFFANHGYNANLFQESKKATVLTEQVNITATEMQTLHRELKQDIEFLLHWSAFYHNQHRSRGPMLKEGDKVYLLQKNIETTRSSNKLDHVKIRPFRIIRNIKKVSFELELSEDMWWKHPVFHVSLLEPASDNVPVLKQVPDNYLMEQEDQYKVEKILKYKDISKKRHYLVKWKDYLNFKNIWESEENLDRCSETIEKYLWKEHSQINKQNQILLKSWSGWMTHSKGNHSEKAWQLPQKLA